MMTLKQALMWEIAYARDNAMQSFWVRDAMGTGAVDRAAYRLTHHAAGCPWSGFRG